MKDSSRAFSLWDQVEVAAALCGRHTRRKPMRRRLRVGFCLVWVTAADGSMHLHVDTTFYNGGDAEV